GIDVTIERDGLLRIDERIEYDFGSEPRHGIYRDVVTRQRYDDTYDRVYNLTVERVEADRGVAGRGRGHGRFPVGGRGSPQKLTRPPRGVKHGGAGLADNGPCATSSSCSATSSTGALRPSTASMRRWTACGWPRRATSPSPCARASPASPCSSPACATSATRCAPRASWSSTTRSRRCRVRRRAWRAP
ncbi:MAG: DUF2207 domain-containing protein, partial [Gammaproteobacteria bacterium]|nr:DUF2207 domain-containing protein [Gammaproteobacteria bacterium]